MVRRWWVTVPLIAVTLGFVLVVGGRVSQSYSASGTLLVQGPSKQTVDLPDGVQQEVPVNPLDQFDGRMSGVTTSLAFSATSPNMRRQIAEDGLLPGYTVVQQTRTALLTISVEASRRQLALDTIDGVVKRMREYLNEVQGSFAKDPTTRATYVVVAPPTIDASTTKSQLRSQAAILFVGGLVTMAAAIGVDVLLGRQRDRRRTLARLGQGPGRAPESWHHPSESVLSRHGD